jgi:hypothetical protein
VFDAYGEGWHLMSIQNHKTAVGDPELVEGGQLVAMYVKPTLGRDLELWYSSATGPGTIESHIRFGVANGSFFSPVALVAGSFPNGSFFGIDLSLFDLVSQHLAGSPFSGSLNADGWFNSPTFGPVPGGLTIYGVAIDDVFSITPKCRFP